MIIYKHPDIQNPIDMLEEIYKNEWVEVQIFSNEFPITTHICNKLSIDLTGVASVIAKALGIKPENKAIWIFPYKHVDRYEDSYYYTIVSWTDGSFSKGTDKLYHLKGYTKNIYICMI